MRDFCRPSLFRRASADSSAYHVHRWGCAVGIPWPVVAQLLTPVLVTQMERWTRPVGSHSRRYCSGGRSGGQRNVVLEMNQGKGARNPPPLEYEPRMPTIRIKASSPPLTHRNGERRYTFKLSTSFSTLLLNCSLSMPLPLLESRSTRGLRMTQSVKGPVWICRSRKRSDSGMGEVMRTRW